MAVNIQQPTVSAIKPLSAPPPAKQLSDEERRALFAELRKRLSTSLIATTPPPGMHAYWARKNDEGELSRLGALGFFIVNDEPPPNNKWKAGGHRADGTYVVGDVILMGIPEEYFQFYLDENDRQSSSMVASVKESFVSEAEKVGVPTFETKPKRKE
jgi:hypothetical protein